MKKIDKQIEVCQRCGNPYPVKGIMVCPCHPMFDKDYDWDGEYFEFKTPDDAKRCLEWIDSLLSSQRDELVKELEDMPINKHEVHYYIEVEGHKECIKCYAIKQMHILARRYANKP